MKIYGLQKLTLLDYPGKIACTVFTGGCGFRCPFCHNAGLVLSPGDEGSISESDMSAFLKARSKVLDGVCITGGEPTLQSGLEDFIREARSLGYLIKLDTNGAQPQKLAALMRAGLLDYVAMDVKNSLQKYPATVGVPGFDAEPVLQSIRLLTEGGVQYEFRTTVVRELHTPEDIRGITRLIQGAQRYFLQPFVDSGNLICSGYSRHTDDELSALLTAARETLPQTQLRGA